MLEIGSYSYVETRLAFLDAQFRSADNDRDRVFTLYLGLSNLIDYLPEDVKPFVEWWILKNDFENVKDAIAQMLGDIRYGFSRPFIRIKKETLLSLIISRDLTGLLDLLSSFYEGIRKEDFENLSSYSEFAFNLDKSYFQWFDNILPKRPDDELAKKLVTTRVDLLNLKLLKRVTDFKRFFIPYGLLSIEDIMNEQRLGERMFELYGVRDRVDLQNYYRNICKSYSSGFAGIMDFIVSHECMIGKGGVF